MGVQHIRIFLKGLVLLLAATSGVAGCGPDPTKAEQAAADGVLLVGNGAEPDTLDPHLLVGIPEANIVSALGEGLVVQDPDRVDAVRPGVAERWSHSPDFRRWTFHLRKNAKWSDGRAVTAADFVYSFRRILSPKLGADGADLLYVIRNARGYNRGEIADFGDVGIAAPTPYRLDFTLAYPDPYLLPMLAGTSFFPVNREAVEAGGAGDDPRNRWAAAGRYVGNGPFVLTAWEPGHAITVERNPQYWDVAHVGLNEIRFVPIEDPAREVAEFLRGGLHLTDGIPAADEARIKGQWPDALMRDDMLTTEVYSLNTRRPPLADVRVRRALSLAIDRAALVAQLPSRPVASGGLVPSGMPGYASVAPPSPDPLAARALLAQAGFPDGRGFPPLSVLVNRHPVNERVAAIVARQWRETLGITVTVEAVAWKDYLARVERRDFAIARAGWVASYPDPGSFLDLMLGDGPSNETGWSDPGFDALLAGARMQSDAPARMAAMRRAEDRMLAQQPVIPLMRLTPAYLLDPRVKGWGKGANGNRVYKFVTFGESN